MSRRKLEFPQAERFVIGTVGVPGEREFFLQIKQAGKFASFALEKSQASALSERARELLQEVGILHGNSLGDSAPLETPIESEFTIGVMSLTWNPESKSIGFEAQAMTDASGEIVFEELVDDEEPVAPAIVLARLSAEMLRGFIKRTPQVVAAGRQPCVFCGGPINPSGHLCPRANGHLRRP